jgi:hypothetical protein
MKSRKDTPMSAQRPNPMPTSAPPGFAIPENGETVDQPTSAPTAKVRAAGTAGAAAGAASILIVFIAGELGLEISNEVAAAITALLTTLLAVAGGYLKRERAVATP